ncbi:MAG: glycosyltransferase family 4 protein, partial [Bacteroidia bacterium]|nr:glycosyltransferase family 4 protein [Bacteroidia bacterium]
MSKPRKILLIGPMPPPSGGVSTHLQRLLHRSRTESDLELKVLDIRRLRLHSVDQKSRNLLKIFAAFFAAEMIHIHISRKAKLFLADLTKFFRKKLIYTHHNARNLTDETTIRIMRKADQIVFVNAIPEEMHFELRKKCNVIPAFIPADSESKLPDELLKEFGSGIILFTLCFQSNNSPILVDGKDIYGFDLIFDALEKVMEQEPHSMIKLFIADPTDAMWSFYKERIEKLKAKTGLKIIYERREIDFSSALNHCSLLIRATRSDGDSLSVREALSKGVPVLASNCTQRPEGVNTFASDDVNSLVRELKFMLANPVKQVFEQSDYAVQLFGLYRKVCNFKE